MPSSSLDKYFEICTQLGEKPVAPLEEILQRNTNTIDVSKIYLPRKHFGCLLRFVEERPNIEELILDGTTLSTEDVKALQNSLLRACVSKVSLRKIKMDATSATTLRHLCMVNRGIVEINLEETCIPSSKIEEIQLIVNLNRLNAESLVSSSVVAVQNEASQVERWQLCREQSTLGQKSHTLFKPYATRAIIDEFVLSRSTFFSDAQFSPNNFQFPLNQLQVVRWKNFSEMEDSQKGFFVSDEVGFAESNFYKNAYLCAALNALSPYEDLTKSLLSKGYPKPGLYVFRLFIDGSATEVVVDDLLPCLISEGKYFLLGVSSCCHPFYGALLEKAIAKALGGYNAIEDLSFCDCIEALTGGTCFRINLTAKTFNSTAAFELLRLLSESGHKLVACPVPRSEREAQAFESDGIGCGLPYTILKADVCRKKGAHYAYLLQVTTPFSDRAVRCAFEHEQFQSAEVNGRLVVWMTLEDFTVVFEQVYLIMWSHDDAASDHKVTKDFPAVSSVSATSTLFARNSSFYIENVGNGPSGVMVSMRATGSSDPLNKSRCLFYKYIDTGGGKPARRYDICEKNALCQSDDFWHSEGSIFFNLLPREKLQMTVASQSKASLTIRFSTVESVKLSELGETMLPLTLIGEWNTSAHGKRFSDRLLCLTNESRECNTHAVLALSQSQEQDSFFPIGALGWIGNSVDVVNVSTPQFSTAIERGAMTVHNIFLSVAPHECLFILPFCIGARCANTFELTIFTLQEMSRTLRDTVDFL